MRTAIAARPFVATLTLLTLSASSGPIWAATIVYQSTVLANNPVAFWRLGESSGTTMVDQSGNGHNGTYSNVTLGATGVGPGSDTAGIFNGTSSSSNIPDSPAFNLLDFTLETWIQLDSPTDPNIRVLNQQDGSGYWLLHLSQAGVGDWRLTAYSSLDGIGGAIRGPNLNDGEFHQIVLVRDTVNDVFSFYVDGALTGPTIALPVVNAAYNINDNVTLGSYDGTAQFFPGIIDEAVIFNIALTAAQIEANFIAATTPPVPEPSTFGLLGLGGLGLASRTRGRMRRVG